MNILKQISELPNAYQYFNKILPRIPNEIDNPFDELVDYEILGLVDLKFKSCHRLINCFQFNNFLFENKLNSEITIPENKIFASINKAIPKQFLRNPNDSSIDEQRSFGGRTNSETYLKINEVVEIVSFFQIPYDDNAIENDNLSLDEINKNELYLLVRNQKGYIYDLVLTEIDLIDFKNKKIRILK